MRVSWGVGALVWVRVIAIKVWDPICIPNYCATRALRKRTPHAFSQHSHGSKPFSTALTNIDKRC